MNYCSKCGTKLTTKYLENEGNVPYCDTCNSFCFPTFNSAISTVVFNKNKDKILLIKQYNKSSNILVAGYINKGENAKEALLREVKEEVNLNVVEYKYNDNFYYEKSNTLIHNYISYVEEDNFTLNNEVDAAAWYTIEEAKQAIKPDSLAEKFLLLALEKIKKA